MTTRSLEPGIVRLHAGQTTPRPLANGYDYWVRCQQVQVHCGVMDALDADWLIVDKHALNGLQ
jgi:hypothetical protein